MTGIELYEKYTSKRDFSGSVQDEYAQLLHTIRLQIDKAIFKLLEKAESLGKKLSVKEDSSDLPFGSEITTESIIFL